MDSRQLKEDLAFLSSLDHRPLKPLEMVAAVEIEKARRQEKGYSFNCIVTDCDKLTPIWNPPKTKGGQATITSSKTNQLNYTLAQLKRLYDAGKLKEGERVQLLVHQDTHWTAVDIEFKSSTTGGISCFIIDAANDAKWHDIRDTIKNHFQPNNLYVCAGDIQTDAENCSSFSLHHAFQSAKIADLYAYLASKKDSFQHDPVQNDYRVSMFQLPPQLVMMTQGSRRLLKSYFEEHPHLVNYPIKEQHFIDFVTTRSEMKMVINKEHKTNPDAPMLRPGLENQYVYQFKAKQKIKVKEYGESETALVKTIGYHVQQSLGALSKAHQPAYEKHRAVDIMTPPEGPVSTPTENTNNSAMTPSSATPPPPPSSDSITEKKTGMSWERLFAKPSHSSSTPTPAPPESPASEIDDKPKPQ